MTWHRSRAKGRDRQPSRHLAYFALVDALAEAGCPVCTLGLRAVARYLDGLAYEQVNDPGVRAVLRAAHGFCSRHAWQFADLPHAHLGTAIIYRDIAATLLHGLTRRRPLPFAGQSAASVGALAPRRPCPACVVLNEASATALRALIGYLNADDPECCHRYQASGGLCRPHLAVALSLARRPRTRALLAATAAAALDAAAGPSVSTATRVELLAGKEGAVSSVLTVEQQGRGRTALNCVLRAAYCVLRKTQYAIRGDGPPADDGCAACTGALAAADDFLCRLAEEVAQEHRPGTDLMLCNRHLWRLVRAAPQAGPRGAAGPGGAASPHRPFGRAR